MLKDGQFCPSIFLKGIYDEIKSRYEKYLTDIENISYNDSPYVLIINNHDSVERLCSSKERLAGYKKMMKKYRKMGIYVIFTFLEDAPISYGSCEIIKGIKEHKTAIAITDNVKDIKLFDINSGVAKHLKILVKTMYNASGEAVCAK